MSYYQGGILNTWHDFQISQNRQYIVSSGFSITNSKEYTDFYSVFSIQKKIWKKKSDIFSENLSFKNYCQLSDIPKSCHFIRAVYWTPDMIFKSRKIGNILFHQVFQKQILRNILICIVYFIYKQIWKKIWEIFPKYEFQKLLSIKRHPKMMSCYQGGILNTWHDFQISQNRQYIVSSGFSKTKPKEYTDFYCIFSIQKNLKKKIR